MFKVAGLDVHGKQCTFVIQNDMGEVIGEGVFPTTIAGIADFVAEHELEGCFIGLESGSVSNFVARQLLANKCKPVIVDAAEVRAKARSKRQKSDRRDAFEICDGLRRNTFVSIVHLPDATSQELRDTLSQRRYFVRARSAEVISVKAQLRRSGQAELCRAMTSKKAFESLLKEPQLDTKQKQQIERHYAVWQCLQEQVAALDKELQRIAKPEQESINRLKTVPGVGDMVAMTTVAYFCNPSRFSDAKHAASYTGLVAQTYSSADRERYGHITRRGPRELRAMLVEAAQHARRKGHPLNAFYLRIAAKKGPKVAICAVAHRLSRILWAMMVRGTDFDPSKLGLRAHGDKWVKLTAKLMPDNTIAA